MLRRSVTVFHKTRMRENAEVDRAGMVQQQCEIEHRPAHSHEIYDRAVKEEEL
jgi:hypothetical protein